MHSSLGLITFPHCFRLSSMILFVVVFLLQILFGPSFTNLTFQLHFILGPISHALAFLLSHSPPSVAQTLQSVIALFCIVPTICKFQLSNLAESLMRSRSGIAVLPFSQLKESLSPLPLEGSESVYLLITAIIFPSDSLTLLTLPSCLTCVLIFLFAFPKWGLLPGLNFQLCAIHSFNFPPL